MKDLVRYHIGDFNFKRLFKVNEVAFSKKG